MLKYAKIINDTTKECSVGLGTNESFYQSIGMMKMDVERAYNGRWYVAGYEPEEPAPTEEEQRKKREQAYTKEVDPITCHIQRLEDEEQTPEIEQEIVDLKQQRAEAVERIKTEYPYPVENDPEYSILIQG